MSRRLLVPLVGVLLATLATAGCSGATPVSTRSAAPTPLSRLNTVSMVLSRGEFCSRVPLAAVRATIGGKDTSAASWRNGDKAAVEDGLDDVVHEFGCRFTRGDTSASAWIFARATTPEQAAKVIASSARRTGCEAADGPSFGSPSQRQVCTLANGAQRVRVAGLFGDSWLACQVEAPSTVPSATVASRADAWCVNVAHAAKNAS